MVLDVTDQELTIQDGLAVLVFRKANPETRTKRATDQSLSER